MTTALNLATLNAASAQPASSQAQAASSTGANDGSNPSFSQVLAGQSSNNTAQNQASNNSPQQTRQQISASGNATASNDQNAQAANQSGNAASPTNGKPAGKSSAKNDDDQDDSKQDAIGIAINTLTNTATPQTLSSHQIQQLATTQPGAQTAPSLPQQALEIAAQVAAMQTQVANRQPTAQTSSSSNVTSVLGTTTTVAKSTTSAAAKAAAILPATALLSQNTAGTAEPATVTAEPATIAVALPQSVATQSAAPTQTPVQGVRRTAVNGINPVASSATKQTANVTHDSTQASDNASTANATQQQVLLAAQPAVTPQHTAALAVQANGNLASLTATASTGSSQSAANTTSSQVPAVLNLTATPVGSAQWNTDLGRQMVLLSSNAQNGNQTAELRLDPPNLGPLHVTISLTDGIATATFVSAHAVVRQALESAMPQLQTAFEQAGLSLGQTSVGDQNAQSGEQQTTGGRSGRSASVQVDNGNTVTAVLQVSAARNANALVDTFA